MAVNQRPVFGSVQVAFSGKPYDRYFGTEANTRTCFCDGLAGTFVHNCYMGEARAPLCLVVPLIVYNGESGWTAARSMAELIPVPPSLAEHQITFRRMLLDLHELPDDQIKGEPVLRCTIASTIP